LQLSQIFAPRSKTLAVVVSPDEPKLGHPTDSSSDLMIFGEKWIEVGVVFGIRNSM
jgi:hypothetical protein